MAVLFAGFGRGAARAALLGELVLLAADELLLAGVGGQLDGLDLLSLLHLREVDVDGFGHRGGHGRRGIRQHGDPGVDGRAERPLAEDGDGGQRLGTEFPDQRGDIRRRVEGQQPVLLEVHVVEVGRHGTGQDDGVEREFELGERLGQLGLVGLAQGQHEFFFLMLDYQLDERRKRAVSERNLAFAVDDVFLQIERHGLRLADVLHGFGNGNAGLFADVEKTVDRRAGGEDHGRMGEYLDSLSAKFLQRDAYDTDERFVCDLHVVFLGEFVERRLFEDCGSRLRNQYFLDFQLSGN